MIFLCLFGGGALVPAVRFASEAVVSFLSLFGVAIPYRHKLEDPSKLPAEMVEEMAHAASLPKEV